VTTPKTLTYRAVTYLAMATVNEAKLLDIRNESCYTTGTGSSPRGLLVQFPVAAERAREHRPDNIRGHPETATERPEPAALPTDPFGSGCAARVT
jgi:hypothetical protein